MNHPQQRRAGSIGLLVLPLLCLVGSLVGAAEPADTPTADPAQNQAQPSAVPHQPPAPVDPPVELPSPPAAPAAEQPTVTEQPTPAATQPTPDEPVPDEPAEESTDESDPDALAADEDAADGKQSDGLPLDDLRTFAEVFGRIKSDYVEDVDDRELLASAIRGMLGGLDPHSSYLDPDAYRDLRVGTTGEFGGLGIEVGMEDGFVKVIAPIDDTPAQRAGMQAGDLIVRIDGKPVKGMSLSDAVALMRGKPGSKIELTVVREDAGNPLNVTIIRDVIKVASVRSRTLEPGYGYLRISNFQARTTEDLLAEVAELKAANVDGLKGVVLDLRNNPGGVLNSAVGVSDAFLDEGLIVYTMGRDEEGKLEFRAGPDDILDDAPLAVLVNGGSASASEIVAGALQDQRRAVIMGEKTFGKGSVQTIVPIDDRTALKLTTARYYTPSGRSIQAMGIEPDIELARGNLDVQTEPDVAPLKEADLMRHLEDAEDSDTEQLDANDAENPADGDDATPLAAEDYQLSEALNVLKGLNLFRGASAPQP